MIAAYIQHQPQGISTHFPLLDQNQSHPSAVRMLLLIPHLTATSAEKPMLNRTA